MALPHFKLHDVSENESGWGPLTTQKLEQFADIPYTPYSKSDKLGRVADWYEAENTTGRDQRMRNRRLEQYQGYGGGTTSVFAQQQDDDEGSFSLVENRSANVKRNMGRGAGGRGGQRGGAAGARGRGLQRLGAGGRGGAHSTRGGHMNNGRRRFGWRDFDRPHHVRYATVTVGEDWNVVEEIEFHRMSRLQYEVEEPTDVALCGHVSPYTKLADRINVRTEQPLRRSEYVHYDVSASDDPIIERLARENKAQVFATDAVLSILMCTTRTVYPWDIVVNRVGDKLYLDKRPRGPLDYLTVNENAADPPVDSKDKDNVNTPSALAYEATRVNHEFALQVVDTKQRIDLAQPNPFHEEGATEKPAPAAYRYRMFDISTFKGDGDAVQVAKPCHLVVRSQLDAALTGTTAANATFTILHALNQSDIRAPGNGGALDWRKKLDTARGAVVATEIKNNNAKLARWALEGIVAGVPQIKFGYVARTNPRDSKRHGLLGVQSFKPAELARQLNVSIPNAWGVVKAVVDLCLQLPEGKYVLARDPVKPVLRIYGVPLDTFENDDEEDEEQADGSKPETA
ncbi:hypothetical protein IWQ60_001536 [Tieghemiomyces parasiticus]|uniref:Eukaryotic translation initiation factor 3 subunit D n=1 Tax=Tieghemiomyces parasiticus TaxID=78921 RepID=A0A9W8DWI6_9FUNG|nr:hypothetical protein IWQ60_001536 [Tieghemiomyces parasiticus]